MLKANHVYWISTHRMKNIKNSRTCGEGEILSDVIHTPGREKDPDGGAQGIQYAGSEV